MSLTITLSLAAIVGIMIAGVLLPILPLGIGVLVLIFGSQPLVGVGLVVYGVLVILGWAAFNVWLMGQTTKSWR